MKSYTSLEQSKKLAEILPIESADMWWVERKPVYYLSFTKPSEENYSQDTIKDIPCWSLATLLDYISANFHINIKYLDNYWELDCRVQVTYNKELIDACVEMIIKLKEKGLL